MMERITKDELERRVDEVLFYMWDPIGINHYPSARAEYRSYVSSILTCLESGEKSKLIILLQEIQVINMGLELDPELAKSTASLLLDNKQAIDKGHA